jgi:hypothetical protein
VLFAEINISFWRVFPKLITISLIIILANRKSDFRNAKRMPSRFQNQQFDRHAKGHGWTWIYRTLPSTGGESPSIQFAAGTEAESFRPHHGDAGGGASSTAGRQDGALRPWGEEASSTVQALSFYDVSPD